MEGFLQKTIWAAMFHATNAVVCGALGWIVWAGSAEIVQRWRGVILMLSIMSAFGGVGVVWELAAHLVRIRKVRRILERTDLAMSAEQRAELQTSPIVPIAIAHYSLTVAAAACLALIVYRMVGTA